MSWIRSHGLSTLMLSAILVLGMLPLTVFAAHRYTIGKHHIELAPNMPVIIFGRENGNIRPFTVTITSSGQVTVNGTIHVVNAHPTLNTDVLKGLIKLAEAEGFFTMPNFIGSHSAATSDIASLYITINTTAGSKTVVLHAAHNAQFNQLFAVLMAVAGITY
jgi:hypothetical protein